MKIQTRSIEKIIQEQVSRWEISKMDRSGKPPGPVITVSREAGTGGSKVAQMLAEELKFDLFDREIIQQVSESAKISANVVETLDEKQRLFVEDWINATVTERSMLPDSYLHHLMKVVGTICKHGKSVIVGRGANFILPSDARFAVRIVAPFETRVSNLARDHSLSLEDAQKRVINDDSNRRAFVRMHFHVDIADPANYDLVINTKNLSHEKVMKIIIAAM